MKLIGIGRNYAEHIEELNNERPSEPVVFLMPDSALLRNNDPFYYPDYSKDIHHEVEIVLRINRVGKHIDEKFASKYYDEIALGIDFTARDLQAKAKEKGLPWTLAKGFDGAAVISRYIPKKNFKDLNDLNFGLEIDNNTVQKGNTSLMLFSFDYIISYVSRFMTLKKGDLIYTGTPKGVGHIEIGNRIKGYIEGEKLLDFEVK